MTWYRPAWVWVSFRGVVIIWVIGVGKAGADWVVNVEHICRGVEGVGFSVRVTPVTGEVVFAGSANCRCRLKGPISWPHPVIELQPGPPFNLQRRQHMVQQTVTQHFWHAVHLHLAGGLSM